VEDEPALLDLLITYLARSGELSVQGVTSAKEAREHLTKQSYDVIISDYEMPETDGLVFLKELRREGNTIPFIIFTGRGCEEVAIEALNSGADFYLQKGSSTRTLATDLVNCIRKTQEKKQTQQDILASERRYRAVVESQTELISRFTPDGIMVFANEAFCRYYHMPCKDLIGRRYIPDIPPDDKKRIQSHLSGLTQENPEAMIEHRILMPDGTIRWQQWSDLAIFNEDGSLVEYQSVGRDITEKKEMEKTLIEHLNYVKALMDTIPAPVFFRDIHGVYQDSNRAFEDLVGLQRDEIIGKTIYDFFPRNLADHYRYMDDLIIKSPYIQQYEYMITNAKGETLDVLFSKKALTSADGSVRGIIGVIFDISDRKRFEQIVYENEEKYRALAEFTYDWEGWLSPEGDYLYVSPSSERITGYLPEEFIADSELIIRITHPEDREMVQKHYQMMPMKKTGIHHMDYRIITKSGQERWISHYCQSIFRDDETWLGSRESKRDITFRKQIERALQRANIKLHLLSSITRHDILNQLSALIGFTDLALEMTSDPEMKMVLNKVMGTAETITEQISFTRMYQDIGLQEPVWQHIPSIIRRASAGIRIRSIEIDNSLEYLEVLADPLLEKVFFSLLDNSMRHGKEVSLARFSLEKEEKVIVLVYEDNGGGIAEEDKERIFEKGFGKNTGFGLFLSREILALSGNFIRETGHFGQGARFEIGFPIECSRYNRDEQAGITHKPDT
jgi:PAS domain S-box-containing protein